MKYLVLTEAEYQALSVIVENGWNITKDTGADNGITQRRVMVMFRNPYTLEKLRAILEKKVYKSAFTLGKLSGYCSGFKRGLNLRKESNNG